MNRKIFEGLNSTFVTLDALSLVIVFLSPFAVMLFTSLKTREQISVVGAPIWPADSYPGCRGRPHQARDDTDLEKAAGTVTEDPDGPADP